MKNCGWIPFQWSIATVCLNLISASMALGVPWDYLGTIGEEAIEVRGLSFGNGRFVAATDDSGVFTSAEGTDWERHVIAVGLRRIAYGAGWFVAVTDDPDQLALSEDGRAWELVETPAALSSGADLFYAKGDFYVTSDGTTYKSSNARQWSVLDRPDGMKFIYAGNDLWVVEGGMRYNGRDAYGNELRFKQFHYSRNRSSWHAYELELKKGKYIDQYFSGMSAGNGTFAILIQEYLGSAKEDAAQILATDDFQGWSSQRIHSAYARGLWFAGERFFFAYISGISSSSNARDWRAEGRFAGLWDPLVFAFGNGRYLVVQEQDVWRSPLQEPISFEEWLAAEGIPEEELNEWLDSKESFPPLLRFAAGWPLEGGPPAELRPRMATSPDGDRGLAVTLRDNAGELEIAAEISDDLVEWQSINSLPRFVEWVDENVKRVLWTPEESTEGADRKFLRLRATELLPELVVTAIRMYEVQRNVLMNRGGLPLAPSDMPVVGRDYVFYVTIRNDGRKPAPDGVIHGISFWVDGGAVSWSDDWDGPLAPGETRDLRSNGGPAGSPVWAPSEVGEKEIAAWVDDLGRVREADDTNNKSSITFLVHDRPDLIVTDIGIYRADRLVETTNNEPLPESDEVEAGEVYVFYATIKNIGEGPTPRGVIHGVSFWVDGEAVNWSDHREWPLTSGQTLHLRANGGPVGIDTWTPTEAGAREIMAWVDDVDRIDETDNTNNQYWRTLYIAPGGD